MKPDCTARLICRGAQRGVSHVARNRYRHRRHARARWWTPKAGSYARLHRSRMKRCMMPQPLWAEQRPENWWDAAQSAIRGVLAQAGIERQQIRASGCPARCTAWCCWMPREQVIRPALIWCDQRSQAQVDASTEGRDGARAGVHRQSGADRLHPAQAAVGARSRSRSIFARVRKVLLPKDYIRFRLTGEYASEVSDASGTALFDVVNRRWSYELVERLGLDRGILPRSTNRAKSRA